MLIKVTYKTGVMHRRGDFVFDLKNTVNLWSS